MDDSGRQRPAGEHVPENIFLVGLMGAGKTSVGRLLARRLGKTFIDCDQEIEHATGVKVAVIFEIEGEAGFRAREAKMLAELARRRNVVLATGGGAVLAAENRRLLSENGVVVYLRAATSELLQRTRHDKGRPLLQTSDPMSKLEQLVGERDPLYREMADIIVDTGSQSVGSLAHTLERKLSQFSDSSGERGETPLDTGRRQPTS